MLVLMVEAHHCDLPFKAGAGLSAELLERCAFFLRETVEPCSPAKLYIKNRGKKGVTGSVS
jgi:hypothetical protein